jgi:Ni/Co efflux regulator RcnB
MQQDNTPRHALRFLFAASASLILIMPAAALAAAPGGGHGGGPVGGHVGGGHVGGHVGGFHAHGGPVGGLGGQFGAGGLYRGYDGSEQHDSHGNAGDRRGFGRDLHSLQQFHHGGYHRPDGWYAHAWRHGDIMPPLFWATDLWLTDYWLYDLSPPPFGYVWVRDDDDALLIDRSTGEVVEVIHGVFY